MRARVTGIGESPVEALDPELKSWLYGYERISTIADEGALLAAVRRVQEREWVDRREATVEAHILPVARVREAFAPLEAEWLDATDDPEWAPDPAWVEETAARAFERCDALVRGFAP